MILIRMIEVVKCLKNFFSWEEMDYVGGEMRQICKIKYELSVNSSLVVAVGMTLQRDEF